MHDIVTFSWYYPVAWIKCLKSCSHWDRGDDEIVRYCDAGHPKAEALKGGDPVLPDLGLSLKSASGSALFLDTAKIYHYNRAPWGRKGLTGRLLPRPERPGELDRPHALDDHGKIIVLCPELLLPMERNSMARGYKTCTEPFDHAVSPERSSCM